MKVNLKVSIHIGASKGLFFWYDPREEGPEWTCCLFCVGGKWGTIVPVGTNEPEGDTKLESAIYSCLTC